MRPGAALILAVAPLWAVDSLTIANTTAGDQNAVPRTISRVFKSGEMPRGSYPQPVIDATPASTWQADVLSEWGDGSVRQALISFPLTLAAGATATITFQAASSPCSSGDQTACQGAAYDQSGMLDFDAGGGAGSWDGQIEVTAAVKSGNTGTLAANVKTALAAGRWRYRLKGPVVTEVIVEDATPALQNDMGWWRVPTATLAADITAADETTLTLTEAPNWEAPLTVSVRGEDIRICQIDGPMLTVGDSACPNKDGRGYAGTTAATHSSSLTVYPDEWVDAPGDAYRSLHPVFVVRFYNGWSGVQIDYILENVWTTRLQDLSYSLAIKQGAGLGSTDYSKPRFWHIANKRWRKTLWQGTEPGAVWVDYNLPYMIETGAIPNYDLTLQPSSAAYTTERTLWNGSTHNDQVDMVACSSPTITYGGSPHCGDWFQNMPNVGGRPDIGLLPRWDVLYLMSMGSTTFTQAQKNDFYRWMLSNGNASGNFPVHLRESDTGRWYDSAHTTDAFGKPLSIYARPNYRTYPPSVQYNPDGPDKVVAPGVARSKSDSLAAVGDGTCSYNVFQTDLAHQGAFGFLPYLVTGDYFYETEVQFWAAFNSARGLHARTGYGTIIRGDWAYIGAGEQPRGVAWGLRNLGLAAFVSETGTAEKTYFENAVTQNLEIWEGFANVTDGNYPPADPSCPGYNANTTTSLWCWGRMTIDGNNATHSLHWIDTGTANGLREGLSTSAVYAGTSPWMLHYQIAALGYLQDLGFSSTGLLRQAGKLVIHEISDPDYTPWLVGSYRMPIMSGATTYFESYAALKAARVYSSALFSNVNASQTTVTFVGGCGGTNSMDAGTNSVLQIDSEKVLVSAASGGTNCTLTVTRGWGGTSAASHTAGTTITLLPGENGWSANAASPDMGYAQVARAAMSYMAGFSDGALSGAVAWAWINDPARGVSNAAGLADNPTWAVVSRLQGSGAARRTKLQGRVARSGHAVQQ